MESAFRYVLLPLAERTDTYYPLTAREDVDLEQGLFATLRLTTWKARVRVLSVTNSVTIEIQASPWGSMDSAFATKFTKTYNAQANETVGSTAAGDDNDWATAPDEGDTWLRAAVTAQDGAYVAEVEAWATLFDPAAGANDLDLVSKELRNQNDTDRTRIIRTAERMILTRKLDQNRRGLLLPDKPFRLTYPKAQDAVKAAIAAQADFLLERYLLSRSQDASSLVSLRKMGEFADDVDAILRPFQETEEDLRWVHR